MASITVRQFYDSDQAIYLRDSPQFGEVGRSQQLEGGGLEQVFRRKVWALRAIHQIRKQRKLDHDGHGETQPNAEAITCHTIYSTKVSGTVLLL